MVGFGMQMRLELKPQLSLSQEIIQALELRQQLQLGQYLEVEEQFEGLWNDAEEKGKIRTYHQHGLEFDYALIKKSQVGKELLERFGPAFCVIMTNKNGKAEKVYRFVVENG